MGVFFFFIIIISNLLVQLSISMKNCSVVGWHHYGALWMFFCCKAGCFLFAFMVCRFTFWTRIRAVLIWIHLV